MDGRPEEAQEVFSVESLQDVVADVVEVRNGQSQAGLHRNMPR